MDYNEGNRMFKISLVLCNNAHLDILGSEMTLICIVSCDLDLRAIHALHKSIQHPKKLSLIPRTSKWPYFFLQYVTYL